MDSCTIEDDVYIGPGARIQKGAYIEAGAFITGGTIVPEGQTVPAGQVWEGSPSTYLREVEAEERENFAEQLEEAIQLSVVHHEETSKTAREVISSYDFKLQKLVENSFDKAAREWAEMGLGANQDEDLAGMEVRIIERDLFKGWRNKVNEAWVEPYEQDLSAFPDCKFILQKRRKNRFRERRALRKT